jgi:hypothetical protein
MTNGYWTLLFTNATTTNVYRFTVSAPSISSNALPVTAIDFPSDGSYVLTNQRNFAWHGPTNWLVVGTGQVFGPGSYQSTSLAASVTNWAVTGPLAVNSSAYTFDLQYLTNYPGPGIFIVSTPVNTNGSGPLDGWQSTSVLDSGSSATFTVIATPGVESRGHTNVAWYSFEDDSLFTQDLSGNNNGIAGYGYYVTPPYITNDAEAGHYAVAFPGDGNLTTPADLLTTLAGSFSVSLWLKTSETYGDDYGDQYSAGGDPFGVGREQLGDADGADREPAGVLHGGHAGQHAALVVPQQHGAVRAPGGDARPNLRREAALRQRRAGGGGLRHDQLAGRRERGGDLAEQRAVDLRRDGRDPDLFRGAGAG